MHEVHESDSVRAARLNAEGRALLEDRQFSEASVRLEQARALAPDEPGIHYNLGLLFSDTGRAADVLAADEFALRLNRATRRSVVCGERRCLDHPSNCIGISPHGQNYSLQ